MPNGMITALQMRSAYKDFFNGQLITKSADVEAIRKDAPLNSYVVLSLPDSFADPEDKPADPAPLATTPVETTPAATPANGTTSDTETTDSATQH